MVAKKKYKPRLKTAGKKIVKPKTPVTKINRKESCKQELKNASK